MKGSRLLVMLVLAVALDCSVPLVPEATEDLKGSQEVIRIAATRQPLRLVGDVAVSLEAGPAQILSVQPVQRATAQLARRSVIRQSVRKIPPPHSDLPSAPEGH